MLNGYLFIMMSFYISDGGLKIVAFFVFGMLGVFGKQGHKLIQLRGKFQVFTHIRSSFGRHLLKHVCNTVSVSNILYGILAKSQCGISCRRYIHIAPTCKVCSYGCGLNTLELRLHEILCGGLWGMGNTIEDAYNSCLRCI